MPTAESFTLETDSGPVHGIVDLPDRPGPRPTVVICHGIRSYAVARYLEQALGFTNVINLRGGVAAWARDVDPGMPTY